MVFTDGTARNLKELIGYEEVTYTHRLDENPEIAILQLTQPGGEIYEEFTKHLAPGIIRHPIYDITFPLGFAYENSFDHGKPPVLTEVLKGKRGAILRITDQGPGFDYAAAIEEFKRYREARAMDNYYGDPDAARAHYAHNKGAGFDVLADSQLLCAYEGRGNILNLGLHR